MSLLSKWRILLVTGKTLLGAKYFSKKWGTPLFKLVYQNSQTNAKRDEPGDVRGWSHLDVRVVQTVAKLKTERAHPTWSRQPAITQLQWTTFMKQQRFGIAWSPYFPREAHTLIFHVQSFTLVYQSKQFYRYSAATQQLDNLCGRWGMRARRHAQTVPLIGKWLLCV